MGRNNQIKLDGDKANIKGFINGEQFRIYFRKFKDRHGKTRRIISGPGLQNLTRRRRSV